MGCNNCKTRSKSTQIGSTRMSSKQYLLGPQQHNQRIVSNK